MREALELLLKMTEAHVYKRAEFTDEDWAKAFSKAREALASSSDGDKGSS
jgi:hypothetical protein